MKFQYGKQDWKTFERGEENCYLMTNGLGGFSSLSMIASCSRGDQAVLMACTHSPNHRYNMIHRLEETLELGDIPYPFRRVFLSSQDFQCHEKREEGYGLQTGFSYEDYPVWTYLTEGVEVVRTLALMQGRNVVGVSYRIRNRSQYAVALRVRPHLQFVPKGQRLPVRQEFSFAENRIISNGQTLYLRTNGVCQEIPIQYHEDLYYRDDVKDGKMALGRTAVNHEIYFAVERGQEELLEIVYGMEENLPDMTEILQNVSDHRKNLQERFHDETAKALAASADQFISYRESTGQKTILAGFPFFEDWGRDTMIALVGCCLSTGQYNTAQSILRTFMAHCRNGLMPNLFPEGTQAPAYNTVDAALLFILAVYEYLRRTGDNVFVRQAYPVMQDIIRWYAQGTDYGIHMDQDGLIAAGQGYDQVTWMDVRVEDILPTPRHGKPVEINAYWYNALRIMEELSRRQTQENGNQSREGQSQGEIDYGAMADRVYAVFETLYWNPEKGCLRDVISGTAADDQVRCNQIWAVSLPFSLLSREKEIQVVETVFRKLYTPVGLRTLAPEDDQFHPFYGGAQLDRDLAYHQGTVWTFPLGGYYLAYLKVHDYSWQARAYVKEQLRGIETALREGCVAQLPEIYDGGNPVSSKGCFAQAWSVGEILRVYEVLEYDNYVFDLYGTLADIRTNENKAYLWAKMSELYASLGAAYTPLQLRRAFRRLEEESTLRAQKKAAGFGQRDVLAEPDLTGVFQRMFREKGVSCDRKTARMTAIFFRTLSRQLLMVYDGVRETLEELRARGKHLYLLSNAQSDFTRPELEMLGLADCFDGILISSEEGCKKPCQAFFRRLLERYDISPASCLMVGNDMNSDIAGATSVGMDSLYIHTDTSPGCEGKYSPTYCVMDGDWKKVADILLDSGGYTEREKQE